MREKEPDPWDLIGSQYGYHCEECFKDLNYGEEVKQPDGTILCKDCAESGQTETPTRR